MVLLIAGWTKVLILLCGLGIVATSALVVICVMSPFCLFQRCTNGRDVRKNSDKNSKNNKKLNYNSESREPVELTKLTSSVNQYYQYGSPQFVPEPFVTKSPPPSTVYGHKKFYTTDSCYSSMSPTTEAGSRPNSPTSTMLDEVDSHSVNSPPSVSESEPFVSYGSLSVELKYSVVEDSNTGRLVITIGKAHNLPGREYYVSSCDPFVRVVILKARTRLRRTRSHYMTLSEFQSCTVRKSRNPAFNQTFTVELTRTDIRDCALKFLIFDRDKYVNPSQLAEAMCPLVELKLQSVTSGIPMTLELQEPQQNNGDLLVGLNYLPTAERLSINILRAMNLKYENVTNNIESLNLEVRIFLLLNKKLIKKKKTPTVSATNSPNFNYNFTFDIPLVDLNQIVFIVGLAHRADAISESDDSLLERPSRHDSFIGKVFFGSSIQTQSKSHWQAMLTTPRQQVSSWHILR